MKRLTEAPTPRQEGFVSLPPLAAQRAALLQAEDATFTHAPEGHMTRELCHTVASLSRVRSLQSTRHSFGLQHLADGRARPLCFLFLACYLGSKTIKAATLSDAAKRSKAPVCSGPLVSDGEELASHGTRRARKQGR